MSDGTKPPIDVKSWWANTPDESLDEDDAGFNVKLPPEPQPKQTELLEKLDKKDKRPAPTTKGQTSL